MLTKKIRTYTHDEVFDLIFHSARLVLDTTDFIINTKHSKKEWDERLVKFSREFSRLQIYPELILEEMPKKNKPIVQESFSIQKRELYYGLLGNRSSDVVSLSDVELFEEVCNLLINYKP